MNPAALGEETRQRLLQVATELFARQGFADTTVRELAQGARCNVAAISYHFGSKEKLYEAVMVQTFRELAGRRVASLRAVLDENHGRPTLEAVLASFASAFLDPLLAEEGAELRLRLLLQEMVRQLLPPDLMHRELVAPVSEVLTEALASALPTLSRDEIALVAYSFMAQLVHVVHLHWFFPSKAQRYRSFGPGLVDHIVRFTAGGARALTAQVREEVAS
ncbi:MAG: TetR family transcriptional regulator [Thermoanaerobaculum sp.]